jgi:hypothetical protein
MIRYSFSDNLSLPHIHTHIHTHWRRSQFRSAVLLQFVFPVKQPLLSSHRMLSPCLSPQALNLLYKRVLGNGTNTRTFAACACTCMGVTVHTRESLPLPRTKLSEGTSWGLDPHRDRDVYLRQLEVTQGLCSTQPLLHGGLGERKWKPTAPLHIEAGFQGTIK